MSSKVLFALLVVASAALLAAPVRAVDPYTGAYDGIGNELLRCAEGRLNLCATARIM